MFDWWKVKDLNDKIPNEITKILAKSAFFIKIAKSLGVHAPSAPRFLPRGGTW